MVRVLKKAFKPWQRKRPRQLRGAEGVSLMRWTPAWHMAFSSSQIYLFVTKATGFEYRKKKRKSRCVKGRGKAWCTRPQSCSHEGASAPSWRGPLRTRWAVHEGGTPGRPSNQGSRYPSPSGLVARILEREGQRGSGWGPNSWCRRVGRRWEGVQDLALTKGLYHDPHESTP